jgi:hypothetical protein
MVEIYCKLIIAKRRTFDKIPVAFQADVKTRLAELGYDTNGDIIAKES